MSFSVGRLVSDHIIPPEIFMFSQFQKSVTDCSKSCTKENILRYQNQNEAILNGFQLPKNKAKMTVFKKLCLSAPSIARDKINET